MLFPLDTKPFIHETDERDLREYLETPLPVFSFCTSAELREVRIRMALAVSLGIYVDHALHPDPSFPWPYPMSPKATEQNFFQSTAIHRNVSQWLKSGQVQAAKILNSADGPCAPCKEAAREYDIHDLPQRPIHNCENLNLVGCRCGAVATKINGLSQHG
jgi:hypothetical protein